ncbi:protein ENHANCED DISEASE RESISTANCE 4-like [Durio zibethinus]|uniref:Protein ENHANCED DISEASE RESISTANCE 4-like n=1 Tax=Durio zibethinus TaxID=66656 RepID=A0A6P5YSL0_DURZI|nr:protein ENHANCED DISEASE RESISTANCE 4-like [Durio zibethinus]XP_022743252.1 protein ENHANCED DISEASE RESISTANCE 4-like [Durio zibethinus]
MASGATPKVRLVRCPKCRLVLPEVADFPVYKCGGCDAILVAKNQKAIVKSTSLLQETKVAYADKLVHMSEYEESGSSTPQEALPSPPEYHLSQESGGNQNISCESQSEKHNENLSIEGQHIDQNTSSAIDNNCDKHDGNRSNEGPQNGSGLLQLESLEYCNVQQSGVSIGGSLSTELHHENEELMLVEEANLEAEANDNSSQLEGAYSELETNNKIDSNIGGPSIEYPPATREINLTVTACAAAGEVLSSYNVFSSPNEHLEQSQKSEHQGFDRESTDSFETADFVSPRSELSGPLEYLSKSTTTRSSHAYDGSISSYDGMDDHFPDQQIHLLKNNFKAANYLVPEERHRRDTLPGKGTMNGNSGMQDHARNLSSDLSNTKHYATAKYSKWHRDEALEPVMRHHPPRNWPRLERDEYPSQIPFSQRASLRGNESAGPSHELHDEFPFDSAFHPLEKAEYSEQENMKLFRMVYELQDQISKTCHVNGKPSGRTATDVPWRQKHFPSYYYQERSEEENFYPRYHGRHGHRSSWSQQSRFLPMPVSGGAIKTRHDIDNSCLCCHPQAWQHSEQLPPPIRRHNRGFCRAHRDHSCYNSYGSCFSSPQRYLESDFSIWSHETKSDDKRYRDHEVKRYLREKHNSVRRHLRPTAGGAPFVTCYHCFRPLQLPADFLLFKRRFHQLRCGACSKVLKFSLQKGIHIVPYELVAAEPPPSEVEE